MKILLVEPDYRREKPQTRLLKAAKAKANARNPIPIVIPCHRVIGSTGKLTGFGGGIAVKQTLLDLEQQYR